MCVYVKVKVLIAQSCLTLCYPMNCSQAPLSMEISRQDYQSGLPGDLSGSGTEPKSPVLQADFLSISHQGSPNIKSAAAAKSLQSCPTLCNPIDGRPPGSPVPGILQARTLEWVAISFSKA